VSEVDASGHLLRSFFDKDMLSWPLHLSTIGDHTVLVAYPCQDRVLLLNTEPRHILVASSSQLELRGPRKLCYDELASQLYVVGHAICRPKSTCWRSSHSDSFVFDTKLSIFSLR